MSLIVIIIALIAERFIGSLQEYRRLDWYLRYANWVRSQGTVMQGTAGVLVTAGSLTFLTGLIDGQFDHGFNLLGLAFSIFILVYCMGPRAFYDQVKAFRDAQDANNQESASWYAKDLLERKLTDTELRQLPRTVLEALFVANNHRLLGVIFWFVVLGPMGAVLYRASVTLAKDAATREELSAFDLASSRLAYILNWPTARLVALGYAAMGNFVEGVAHLKGSETIESDRWTDPNEHLLASAGLGSLGLAKTSAADITTSDVVSGLALVRRSVAFWVGVIALLTLVGWLA